MRFVTYSLLTLSTLAAFALASAAEAAWETPATPTTVMAQQSALPAPGVSATIRDPFYKITATDVGAAVAQQLQAQGIEHKAEATLSPGTPSLLYSSDHAITLSLHALQVDPASKRWQAQVHFISNGKTESVKPVAGTYTALVDVPVVTRQLTKMDVIEQQDITLMPMQERLLRKDTITDPKQLLGLSPRNGITPNRPIHTGEVSAPIVIKRGDLVEMAYNTPYIHIKTTGVALEEGSKGATIRIKNQKSQMAVSARVEGAGRVSVNNDTSL